MRCRPCCVRALYEDALMHTIQSRCEHAQVFNLGFTTHTGTVAAADEWAEPVQRMPVNPSIPGSIAIFLSSHLLF